MKNLKISFFTTFLFVFSLNLQAQIIKSGWLNPKLNQYQKAEWQVELRAEWNNPYVDSEVALDMFITSPSGKKLMLPCFYESGNSGETSIWKARFTPRESGVLAGPPLFAL